MRLLIVAIFLLFSGFAIAQTSDLGKTDPTMLENKGQVSNSDGTPADHVLFYMNTPQLDFYLTKTGISYVFKKIEIIPEEGDGRTDPKHRQEKTTVYSHRVDVTAIGAKISSDKTEVEYSDERTVSIYNGLMPQGLENMKPVRTVTLKDVYPGIDWQFVVQDENIKYNFILHEGADLNSIKLRFDGQNKLSIENDRLTINTAYGTLTEEPLVSFLSTGESVNIKQNLQENLLSFTAENLPALQNGQTLTIDPPLVWATFFGGSGVEQVWIIERSLDGFVYMLLETLSSDFPVLDSASLPWYQSTSGGTTDVGILKFNDVGKLIWSSYYGGSGVDKPLNMFCNNNMLVVVGSTTSANFPTQASGFPGAYNNLTRRGNQDGFVLVYGKINPFVDQRLWATYFGGYSNYDAAYDCSINNNSLFVVGRTYFDSLGVEPKTNAAIQFPLQSKAGAYYQDTIRDYDLFIAEFNLMFNKQWCTFYGAEWSDNEPCFDIDSIGRMGIVFSTTSTTLPVFSTLSGSYAQTYNAGVEMGFTMFDQNGQKMMHTYLGGSNHDYPEDLICNQYNEWLITGSTRSTNFPVANTIGAGLYFPTLTGTYNAFLLKLDSTIALDYSTYYGSGTATGYGLTIDSHDNLYLVGSTKGNLFTYNPLDGSYVDSTINSTTVHDGFLLELNDSYNPRWATVIGGSGDDPLYDIRVSPNDHVFVAGYSQSDNQPLQNPGNGAYFDNVRSGTREAIIMKFVPCPEDFDTIWAVDSVCYGETIDIYATGSMTYNWNIGSTNDSIQINVVSDTTITVVATYLTCIERDTVYIKVKPLPLITFTGDSSVCLNDSMHLGVDGGINYVWENGFTTDSISFLPAASETLTVTVTNSYGCTAQDSIQTTVYPLPVPLITGDNTPCLYDTTSLSASGGVSFEWSNAATTPSIDIAWNSTGTFDYNVIATDVNGCSDTAFFTAIVTNLPEFWLGNDTIICDLTSITLDPGIAGASYNWSTGAVTQTLAVSTANTYWLDLNDANSCHFRDTINVAVQALPVITFSGADTTCFGSSITMTATAPTGTSYLWSNGMTTSTITFTPTASGLDTIAVTITDALTCAKTDSLEFMVYALPVPSIAGDVTPCLHDTTTLTASGGISYVWSTGATTTAVDIPFNSMGTYNYYAIATDIHACADTAFYTATVLALPTFWLGNDTIICALTSIPLDPGIAGATYDWSTGAITQSITVNSADTYSLQLTDGNTCKYADTINVAIQVLPVITFSGADTTCLESTITMTATAPTGTSYLWSNGMTTSTITFTPTASGLDTIAVTITDALTCSKTDSLEFMVYALPTPAISGNLSICANDTLALSVAGGVSYLWSSGTASASTNFVWSSPGSQTVYSVATDIHGCSDTAFHTVNVLPQPLFNLGPDTTICAFTIITLTPGITGAAYDWSTGDISQSINIGTADTYILEVTGANGCTYDDSITVAVQPYPTIVFGGDTTVCYSHPITITATGGVTYAWENSMSGASITFVPTATDTLTVVVTDIYGCASTDSVSFDVLPLPVPVITGATEICRYDTTTLTASGGVSYQWSTGQNTATADVSPSVVGLNIIYVIATGANQCYDTAFHQIDVHALPVVDLGIDTTICEGTTLMLDAANAGATFNWSTSAATQTVQVSAAGTYSVTVTDIHTCHNADTIMVSTTPYADATITDVAYICLNGVPFSFVAAQSGGTWTGDGITNAATGQFNPAVAGVGNSLVIYAIAGMCGDADSSVIEVADIPFIAFTATDETCPGLNDGTLILEISGGAAPYGYDLSGATITDTTLNLIPDNYVLTVTDSRGCITADSVTILEEDMPCGEVDFYIPNIFSPNGDLENDVLMVRSNFIESMSWYIYDRFGEKVFESKDVNLGWDGEFQGQPVQSGVYFWHIKTTMIDGTAIEREGNVTVVR